MVSIPKDPFILLSYINTQLRDFYPSIEALCEGLELEKGWLEEKLEEAGCHYSAQTNQFV